MLRLRRGHDDWRRQLNRRGICAEPASGGRPRRDRAQAPGEPARRRDSAHSAARGWRAGDGASTSSSGRSACGADADAPHRDGAPHRGPAGGFRTSGARTTPPFQGPRPSAPGRTPPLGAPVGRATEPRATPAIVPPAVPPARTPPAARPSQASGNLAGHGLLPPAAPRTTPLARPVAFTPRIGASVPPSPGSAPASPPAPTPPRGGSGRPAMPPVPPIAPNRNVRTTGPGLTPVRGGSPVAPSTPAPPVRPRPSIPPSTPPVAAARPASTTPARTPINPFLANDPNAKARRLSRALISDLLTYFPQRRDEGVRNGTLARALPRRNQEELRGVRRSGGEGFRGIDDALPGRVERHLGQRPARFLICRIRYTGDADFAIFRKACPHEPSALCWTARFILGAIDGGKRASATTEPASRAPRGTPEVPLTSMPSATP